MQSEQVNGKRRTKGKAPPGREPGGRMPLERRQGETPNVFRRVLGFSALPDHSLSGKKPMGKSFSTGGLSNSQEIAGQFLYHLLKNVAKILAGLDDLRKYRINTF